MTKHNTVYIELGSNVGNRLNYLTNAKLILETKGCIINQQSAIYETPPWGFTAEQNFYNQVIKIQTTKTAHELLNQLMEIEKNLGRVRGQSRYISRTIDLDILLFNDEIVNTDELVIPHERMHLRNFVLEPLNELASSIVHPVLKKSIQQLLANCPDKSTIKKLHLK